MRVILGSKMRLPREIKEGFTGYGEDKALDLAESLLCRCCEWKR